MRRELNVTWLRRVERPDWDKIKDEPWASPAAQYMESRGGWLVGHCDDPGLLSPFIEGAPKRGNITRFDIFCPDKWKNDRIIINRIDLDRLGFRVMMDPGDYRSVAPASETAGFIRVGRVQCDSDARWIRDVCDNLGISTFDEALASTDESTKDNDMVDNDPVDPISRPAPEGTMPRPGQHVQRQPKPVTSGDPIIRKGRILEEVVRKEHILETMRDYTGKMTKRRKWPWLRNLSKDAGFRIMKEERAKLWPLVRK